MTGSEFDGLIQQQAASWRDAIGQSAYPFLLAFFCILLICYLLTRLALQSSARLTRVHCDVCGQSLKRIRQPQWLKLISFGLPVRRLYCRKCNKKYTRVRPRHA